MKYFLRGGLLGIAISTFGNLLQVDSIFDWAKVIIAVTFTILAAREL